MCDKEGVEFLEHVAAQVETATEEMREGRRKEGMEGGAGDNGSNIYHMDGIYVKKC